MLKKIIFSIFLFLLPLSIFSAYNPGENFHHSYNITNTSEDSCDWTITEVKKEWWTNNITPNGTKAFDKLEPQPGNVIQDPNNNGSHTYNINYTLSPGESANTVINFYSNNSSYGFDVDSKLTIEYDIQDGCGDGGIDTTDSVESSLVGAVCNDLTATPNNGDAPLDVSFDCQANGNVQSYKIEIFDGSIGGNVVETINSSNGSYIFDDINGDEYYAKCTIEDSEGNSITSNACGDNGSVNIDINTSCSISAVGNGSSIENGESTTLKWTGYNANSASIDNGIGAVAITGTKSIDPPDDSTTTYTMNVSGPQSNSCSIDIQSSSSGGGGGGGGGTPGGGGGGGGGTPGGGTTFSNTPDCNYIDPPSIQIGEYLPYWWELKSGIWANTCNSSNVGKYDRGSATCDFEISNGSGENTTFSQSCFSSYWPNLPQDYLSDVGLSSINYDGRNIQNISPSVFSALGEYKIELNQVNYERCEQTGTGSSGSPIYGFVNGTYNGTICQQNFSVTRPYLIQKGTKLSTNNNDVLGDFYDISGNSIINPSKLNNITVSSFSGGTSVDYILNEFMKKYGKISVKTITLPSLGLTNIKKVPNKNIYIIDASRHGGTITIPSSSSLSKTATFIVKNGDLKIKDSISGKIGMFIVPDGDIIFENTTCDSQDIVKGIFITKNSYKTNSIKNDNPGDNWCDDGRLKIIGTLIGPSGVNNLWQKRRAVMDNFFNVGASTQENKIYNGGSLVVETDTSSWTNLPPGAEEFLKKLQIYKK